MEIARQKVHQTLIYINFFLILVEERHPLKQGLKP